MSSSVSLDSEEDTRVSGASRLSSDLPHHVREGDRPRFGETSSPEPDSNILNRSSQKLLNELRNWNLTNQPCAKIRDNKQKSKPDKSGVHCTCHINRGDKIDKNSSHCWGTVVGIRKLPMDGNKMQQAKCDSVSRCCDQHAKLKAEHENLLGQFNDTISKFRCKLERKDNELENSKRKVDSIGTRCRCNQTVDQSKQVDTQLHRKSLEATVLKLEHELELLEARIGTKERDHDEQVRALKVENDLLRSRLEQQRNEFESEMNNMRISMQSMLTDPNSRTLLQLRRENSQLKDINESDLMEYQTLKDKYKQLEDQLKSLMNNYKSIDQDKDKEMSELFLELCRLQVYQPKLEMNLETERAIRSELQNKLEALTNENNNLREQIKERGSELVTARIESNMNVSGEISRLHEEISKWQDNFHRLKRDKEDVDELLRISNSKIDLMDARHRGELDSIREEKVRELEKSSKNISKLDSERSRLSDKVGRLERKLTDYEMSNKQLTDEIMELNKRIPSFASDDGAKIKLDACEELNTTLRSQLRDCEARNMELVDDNSRHRNQLERSKQQLEQLQERFRIQLKAFDEMKTAKEDELSKLRISLNFERYNRQVALGGIEKELRCTLKELETMKCRFSRRLGAESDLLAAGHKCMKLCCPNSDSSGRSPKVKEAKA